MACKFRRGGFHIRPRANNVRPYMLYKQKYSFFDKQRLPL